MASGYFTDDLFSSPARGLRVVLTLLKRVKAASGVLALCAVQAPVKEVLDITGFTGMLDVHAGRAEAMAALA